MNAAPAGRDASGLFRHGSMLVAGTLIQSNEMVKPALVYALFSFWTALLYGVAVKWYDGSRLFGEFREIREKKINGNR